MASNILIDRHEENDFNDACQRKDIIAKAVLYIITRQVRKDIAHMRPGKARKRVFSFLMKLEIKHSLYDYILLAKAQSLEETRTFRNNNDDPKARMDALSKINSDKWGRSNEQVQFKEETISTIDEPVEAGGLTRLHVLAQTGTIDEVIELVEEDGANPMVRCNSRLTPRERAMAMGRMDIADYLSQFETKDTDEDAQIA